MNSILRDREHCSVRLVMNPDRMVIKEAQRTFTYLNLYGYLTDAVIVNRVFPDGGRGRLLRRLARAPAASTWRRSREGFAPVPVLEARYFEHEVVGGEMLDRLGDELFDAAGARRKSSTPSSRQELTMDGERRGAPPADPVQPRRPRST